MIHFYNIYPILDGLNIKGNAYSKFFDFFHI
jgi:hypothetical protein